MKFKLINNDKLEIKNDMDAMKDLIKRIEVITEAIRLFNQSDWKLEEVAMWLQYEKDLVITEHKLLIGEDL